MQPQVEKENPTLIKPVDDNCATVDAILATYKTSDDFETYDQLSEGDRKALVGPVTALAEYLSELS